MKARRLRGDEKAKGKRMIGKREDITYHVLYSTVLVRLTIRELRIMGEKGEIRGNH